MTPAGNEPVGKWLKKSDKPSQKKISPRQNSRIDSIPHAWRLIDFSIPKMNPLRS